MNKYTVILLYPDYLADNYGQDIYTDHVEAGSPAEAQAVTQRQLARQHAESDEEDTYPEDFYPLAVFEGHHDNIAVDSDMITPDADQTTE